MLASRLRLKFILPIVGLSVGAVAVPALPLATQAPLELTGRASVCAAIALCAGLVAWAASRLLFGPNGAFAREGGRGGMPVVRRADRHPDAPPRRPLAAAELGAPPCGDGGVPADLDHSLPAFLVAVRPAPLAPGERIESVELPAHAFDGAGAASLESFLARLDAGTPRGRRRLRPANA